MDDHYAVLGVSRDAEDIVIRAAFKALAQRYHPDKSPGNEARMQAINTAYAVLSDPVQRQQYDARYRLTPQRIAAQAHPSRDAQNIHAATVGIDAGVLMGALWFGLRGAVQGGLLFGVVFGLLFGLLGVLGGKLVFGLLFGLALIQAARWQRWDGLMFVVVVALLLAILADALGSAQDGMIWGATWGGFVGALIFGLLGAISGLFKTAMIRAARQQG